MEALVILGLNLFLWWENPPRLSPDGRFYLERPSLRPYSMRYGFVWVASRLRWEWLSKGAVLFTSLILWASHGIVPAVLWLGLSSTRVNTLFPILTDQVGLLCLTLAITLPGPWGILFGLLGGLVNEKVPVFASIIIWNPLPLIGLGVPLYFWWTGNPPLASDPLWLRDPRGEARKVPWDAQTLLFPWGVAVLGLLTTPISCVLLAYAQLFTAQDRARLYQWIGPIVVVQAAGMLPSAYLLPILVLHFLNPFRKAI